MLSFFYTITILLTIKSLQIKKSAILYQTCADFNIPLLIRPKSKKNLKLKKRKIPKSINIEPIPQQQSIESNKEPIIQQEIIEPITQQEIIEPKEEYKYEEKERSIFSIYISFFIPIILNISIVYLISIIKELDKYVYFSLFFDNVYGIILFSISIILVLLYINYLITSFFIEKQKELMKKTWATFIVIFFPLTICNLIKIFEDKINNDPQKILSIFFSFFILILIGSFIVWNIKGLKRKKKELESELNKNDKEVKEAITLTKIISKMESKFKLETCGYFIIYIGLFSLIGCGIFYITSDFYKNITETQSISISISIISLLFIAAAYNKKRKNKQNMEYIYNMCKNESNSTYCNTLHDICKKNPNDKWCTLYFKDK